MFRFLIGIVIAVGLVLSPSAAEARAVLGGGGAECAMDGAMPGTPDMPTDHSKMACCTVACQIPLSAALIPVKGADLLESADGAKHSGAASRRLTSFISAALDPPPRP